METTQITLVEKARKEAHLLCWAAPEFLFFEKSFLRLDKVPDEENGLYSLLGLQGNFRSLQALSLLRQCAEPYSFSKYVYNPTPKLLKLGPLKPDFSEEGFLSFYSALEFLLHKHPVFIPNLIEFFQHPRKVELWIDRADPLLFEPKRWKRPFDRNPYAESA